MSAEILYDNMKHVVVGGDATGKPIFNPECLHFARHYGFQPKACAPYNPWMKGKVERPIGQIRIFLDHDLLTTYLEPATKHNIVAHAQFYEDLRKDREQMRRKYG